MEAVPKRWRRHGTARLARLLAQFEGTEVPPEPTFWDQGDDDDLFSTVWLPKAEGIIVRCELAEPKSVRGRNVDVYIRGTEVEWLLKELREVAIERRSQTIQQTEEQTNS